MAEIPAPSNSQVKLADTIIKVVIKDIAFEIAIKAAVAEVPFLGFPIIINLFRYFAGKFVEKLVQSLMYGIGDLIIDGQVQAQVQIVKDSRKAVLAAIVDGKGNVNEEVEKFKNAYRNLIQHSPS